MTHLLYTLAYPELPAADRQTIVDFQAEYDLPNRPVVAPHFTIGFGCNELSRDEYLSLAQAISAQSKPVSFHCRYAMLGADDNNASAHVFLVPDEGNSDIAKLHDRLYTRPLAPRLRLEFPTCRTLRLPHWTSLGKQGHCATI